MPSIRVANLRKAYKLYPNRWSRLAEWLLPWAPVRHQLKWVLKDISFSVEPGEAVGIIGVNGAGKSTLLKLITGTAQPTGGEIGISGRIAALLELGMGFHPDFTGRQNVLMAGQLIGLTVEEIHTLMPKIEEFAEIGEYIDMPVRVYSSGMQVRLAFSIATVKRPDVLIVDEAMSVGDVYFQHKSFDRIKEFKKQGTTLLIVSHDRGAIQTICDRAILLQQGSIVKEGPPEAVMDFYNALIAERENTTIRQKTLADGRVQTSSGTGEATVEEIALFDDADREVENVNVGQQVTLSIKVRAKAALPRLVMGYMIKDRLGQSMFGTNTHHLAMPLHGLEAGQCVEYRFRFPANFGPGSYSVTTALTSNDHHLLDNYEWRDLALMFVVLNIDRNSFVGCNWIEPQVEVLGAVADPVNLSDVP